MNLKNRVCLLLCAISSFCFAQDIRLSNVDKIKILVRGNVLGENRYVEALKENDSWKSYQIKLTSAYGGADSVRKFIRDIPQDMVIQLIDIINNPDTKINLGHFDFNEAELIKYADTVCTTLRPHQRAEFIALLRSTSKVNKELLRLTKPYSNERLGQSLIAVVGKSGKVYHEMYANVFGDYQAWATDKQLNYDPRIHHIFGYVVGKDQSQARQKKRMYLFVAKQIYEKYLKTKFNWSNFKVGSPALHALLSATLTPVRLNGTGAEIVGEFSSSRLPAYVQLWANFKMTDTNAVKAFKLREDTVVNILKKVKFLTEHYKSNSHPKVLVSSEDDGNHKPYFRFSMTAENNNQSEWLVVDNKSIVLVNYSGQFKDPFSNKFEGIIPNTKNQFINKQAYLIYDFDGNLIGGNKEVGYSDLIFKK